MSLHDTSDEEVNDALAQDTIHHLLANERRRNVIAVVNEVGSISKSELAERVAAMEYGKPPDQLDSQERKRVLISLHQAHLPKLDDGGAIRYDEDRGIIQPCAQIDDLVWYINNGPNQGTKPRFQTLWDVIKN